MIGLKGTIGGKPINWVLGPGKFVVGRASECDFVIEDDTVSRKHAEIVIADDQTVSLRDLGSHNGTIVNGMKIGNTVVLRINDDIYFGRVGFRIVPIDTEHILSASVSISRIDTDLTNALILPMEVALKPLPGHLLGNPKLFEVFSEMGKMLVMPGLNHGIFDNAISLLSELVPAERIALFFATDEKNDLQLVTHFSRRKKGSNTFIVSHTILKQLIVEKSAVVISNPLADPRFQNQESVVSTGARSVMAAPLLEEGKIFGIIYADTIDPKYEFSEDSLRVMAAFGNILAAKINNQNLLRQKEAKEAIEAELAIASQIQRELLPRKLPLIEGYCIEAFQAQCQLVGGDLYDVSLLKDGRIIIVIADVSGKGMGAALLASNILASFRILYNTDYFDLLGAIDLVSDQLLFHSRSGDFATLFAGVLDPGRNKLQFVNAGHNSPMVVRKNGEIEYLESSGIPIGALNQHSWKEKSIEIESGDYIFAFTDGITEATNSEGEQFGEERILRLLQDFKGRDLSDLPAHLNGQVKKFLAQSPQSCDDITMVVIGRNVRNAIS
jgi:serine phosphatase RsbU (regulator of sigma subunit)